VKKELALAVKEMKASFARSQARLRRVNMQLAVQGARSLMHISALKAQHRGTQQQLCKMTEALDGLKDQVYQLHRSKGNLFF
jgi:hypothetical protein